MKNKQDMSPTAVVNEIGQINLSGNIIHNSWYDYVTFPNGKPDLAAIVILSEIFWWYRPREVHDKKTKKFLGYEKKFNGDMLQYGYNQFAEKFGLTRKQVVRACDNLKRLGLIKTEKRTIQLKEARLGNVLFVEPISNKILDITYPENINVIPPCTLEGTRVIPSKVQPLLPESDNPYALEGITYTKSINTEINKEKERDRAPQNGALSPPQNGGDAQSVSDTKEQKPEQKEPQTNSDSKYKFGERDLRGAEWMYNELQKQNPNFKKPNFKTWANDVRLMHEQDKRDYSDMATLWKFAREDSFWMSNILSPAKLREKWDQLWMKMEAQKNVNGKTNGHAANNYRKPAYHQPFVPPA